MLSVESSVGLELFEQAYSKNQVDSISNYGYRYTYNEGVERRMEQVY